MHRSSIEWTMFKVMSWLEFIYYYFNFNKLSFSLFYLSYLFIIIFIKIPLTLCFKKNEFSLVPMDATLFATIYKIRILFEQGFIIAQIRHLSIFYTNDGTGAWLNFLVHFIFIFIFDIFLVYTSFFLYRWINFRFWSREDCT